MTPRSVVPKEVLAQHVAVLGKTRSGKSSVMRGLVESLLDDQKPVCIVDPKGDWWGIKLAADGKRPGYPVVIFGGEHADIPINEHAGAHVAELFATGNRPCLIDLGGWMVGPRTRFWIDFASTLFKHTKGQRWLAVDEIHNFAPKGKIFDAEAGKALHWANRLASEGLGKGLALIFASQRPQKVHNDTLTSAETLIAMRVLHPSDRGAVADWIKGCGDSEGSEVLNSLAQMERGEGWVWSPEIHFGPKRVKFPLFHTYDSFRPQSVEDTKKLKGWAEVDLDEVRAKFDGFIEQAKADDPRELRKQIVELKRELTAKSNSPIPTVAASKTIERHILTEADRALLLRFEDALAQGAADLTADAEQIVEKALEKVAGLFEQQRKDFIASLDGKGFQKILDKLATVQPAGNSSTTGFKPVNSPSPSKHPVSVQSRAPRATTSGEAKVPSTVQRAFLTVLAHRNGKTTTRNQLAVFTGYSAKSSHVDNTISSLRTAEWAVGGRDALAITEAGLSALGEYEPLPTGAALLEHWISEAGPAAGAMLRVIAKAYPKTMTRDEVAEATGYSGSSSHVDNSISRLRTLQLVVGGRHDLRASEELFE